MATFTIRASQVTGYDTYAAFVAGAIEEELTSVPGVGAYRMNDDATHTQVAYHLRSCLRPPR